MTNTTMENKKIEWTDVGVAKVDTNTLIDLLENERVNFYKKRLIKAELKKRKEGRESSSVTREWIAIIISGLLGLVGLILGIINFFK